MAQHRKAPPPRAHWLLLITLLAAVTGLLILHAVVVGPVGTDGTAAPLGGPRTYRPRHGPAAPSSIPARNHP